MSARVPVLKTYKLYIGGGFPRSESGRTFEVGGANVSKASRKDLRDAVSAARKAQPGWAGRTAYNRGQILYRVAEIMEGRRAQFAEELGGDDAQVTAAIDTWIWYAGWCDKVHQVAGSVNPVAGPYYNFTLPEPTGVVGTTTSEDAALLGLVASVAPAVIMGNTAVVLAAMSNPLVAITLAEALATSDVPGGVINVLTGDPVELLPWLVGHADVNAVDLGGIAEPDPAVVADASSNVKQVVYTSGGRTLDDILAFCEMKTVWHPNRI